MFSLSVIIPTYNRAALVQRTLRSLEQQSRGDFQVIVVDHGSTDNTAEACHSFQHILHLTYIKISRDASFAPAVPRDFGVTKALAPLIAFLDAGMIVPTSFVSSHICFHQLHHNTVGIGLQHGHLPLESKQHQYDASSALDSIEHVDQAYPLLMEQGLQDRRQEIDLASTPFPWFFGWTANLSLPRATYQRVHGFDLTFKGWGLEDLEFCYRLYKQGLNFALVPDGWGIELPQSRAPVQERITSSMENMRYCYFKHRSLALESLLFAGMEYRRAESVFHYLTAIKKDCNTPQAHTTRIAMRFARPSLLIGGTTQAADFYDYVTTGDENFSSTPSTWSCSGVFIPLADNSLETVVVSDVWKQLGWSICYFLGLHGMSLLEHLITEIRRIARQAVFLHSNAIPLHNNGPSLALLEQLCHQYDLAYQILAL